MDNVTTGLKLIIDERIIRQIEKHGFTGLHHAQNPQWYDKGQLLQAARVLSYDDDDLPLELGDIIYPENWDKDWFKKLLKKPHFKRVVIAGTFVAAELDRLVELEHLKKPSNGQN